MQNDWFHLNMNMVCGEIKMWWDEQEAATKMTREQQWIKLSYLRMLDLRCNRQAFSSFSSLYNQQRKRCWRTCWHCWMCFALFRSIPTFLNHVEGFALQIRNPHGPRQSSSFCSWPWLCWTIAAIAAWPGTCASKWSPAASACPSRIQSSSCARGTRLPSFVSGHLKDWLIFFHSAYGLEELLHTSIKKLFNAI